MTTATKPKTARKPIPSTETKGATSAVDALAASPTGRSTRVPASELVTADNVRTDLHLDPEFLASVKQHGIIVPVVVYEHDGALYILDGHRRTAAAVKAKISEIPVHVVELTGDTARIVQQLVTNDHRTALTPSDHVAAYHQLALAGLDVDTIAKQTLTDPGKVAKGIRVANSAAVTDAMSALPLTIEQANALADLEEHPDLYEHVLTKAAADPKQLDHAISRARLEQKDRAAKRQLIDDLTAAGYPQILVDESSPHVSAGEASIEMLFLDADRQTRLATSDGERLDPNLPGLIAYVNTWNGDYNRELGQYETVSQAKFTIRGWRDLGYTIRRGWEREAGLNAKGAAGDTVDAAAAEKEKAKRRAVIQNNKDFTAASAIRLAWIREFLTGKDLPTGWELHVATLIAGYSFQIDRHLATNLLSVDDLHPLRGSISENWLTKNKDRGPWYLIALAIAFVEARQEFSKTGWRDDHAAAHLKQLAAWGYTLSDLEEQVVKGKVAGK